MNIVDAVSTDRDNEDTDAYTHIHTHTSMRARVHACMVKDKDARMHTTTCRAKRLINEC